MDNVVVYPSGWDPEIAKRGRDQFFAAGNNFYNGGLFLDDDRPLPDGFSLSALLKWLYDQGPVGSCFANMMAHIHQIMQGALLKRYWEGQMFSPSRRLIWYQCRKLDGSLGSWRAGGSIVNSFAAVGPSPRGVGVCPEDMWPYKANHGWLEQRPPQNVFTEAEQHQVLEVAEVGTDFNLWRRSAYNGHPVGIGIWWPTGWSTRTDGGASTRSVLDQYSRTRSVGGGQFGHALAVIGWLNGWDGHNYLEILNSHGKLYAPPPPEVVARIPGYAHHGYSFWAREDHLVDVWRKGNAEACVGAGVEGFTKTDLGDYVLIG